MHDACDSKRNHSAQDQIASSTVIAVGKLVDVPGRREARAVPDVWRESVARRVRQWRDKHHPGATTRKLATAMEMNQPAVVDLLNCKGSFGLHLLLQVRRAIGVSLDDLLGLPALTTPGLTSEELESVREVLRAKRDKTKRRRVDSPDEEQP